MSNPLDDYLDLKEKTAGPLASGAGEFITGARNVASMQGLGGVAAYGAITAGAMGTVDAVKKIYTAITKKRDFNQMMEANPDLQSYQQENPSQFNQHYNSLRKMNPTFGSEPVVAGTYMRQMSMNPQTAGKVVVESLGGLPADRGVQDFTGVGKFVQQGVPQERPQDPRAQFAPAQEARAAEKHPLEMEALQQRMARARQEQSQQSPQV